MIGGELTPNASRRDDCFTSTASPAEQRRGLLGGSGGAGAGGGSSGRLLAYGRTGAGARAEACSSDAPSASTFSSRLHSFLPTWNNKNLSSILGSASQQRGRGSSVGVASSSGALPPRRASGALGGVKAGDAALPLLGSASSMAAYPTGYGSRSRSNSALSSRQLSPLLEVSRTPPPPPNPLCRACSAALSTAARAGRSCAWHVGTCSCSCLVVLLVVLLLAALTVAVCDRQPSPCGGSFLPPPPAPPLPWLQSASPQPAPQYNETRARTNARLASASYCAKEVVELWQCASCAELRNVSFFVDDITGAAGYVGLAPRLPDPSGLGGSGAIQLVLVFRGTQVNRNWLEDLVALKHMGGEQWGGGAVHVGFLTTYRSLQGYVHQLLLAKRRLAVGLGLLGPTETVNVRLVGHSLGGALATLAAADLLGIQPFRVEELWTFGSPRVGDAKFVAWLLAAERLGGAGVRHWRVTHAHDPVVHVPPLGMGFQHVPTEVWYPDRTPPAKCAQDYYVCDDGPAREDSLCAARVWLPLCVTRSEDHLNYVGVPFDHAANCEWRGMRGVAAAGPIPLLAASRPSPRKATAASAGT